MQNIFSKRNLVIAVAIILILGGAAYWYFFSRNTSNAPANSNSSPGFLSRLFPTSGNRPTNQAGNQNPGNNAGTTAPETNIPNSTLSQLISANISGAAFIYPHTNKVGVGVKGSSASTGKIRYIERSSGHVFEIDPDGKNQNRTSNTTIPGIFDVVWSSAGDRAILKYISGNNLNILSARFTASSTQGIFLSPDIKNITFSPAGDRIAYVTAQNNETQIITATPDNKSQRVIFRSPYSSWRVYWPEAGSIYIVNSPSATLDGFLYKVSVQTGTMEKITGPLLGLNVAGNSKNFFASQSLPGEGTISSSVINLKAKEIKPTTLKIIPEKCVWSKKDLNVAYCGIPLPLPEAIYPDDWYQGKVSFSDIFAKINASTLAVQTLQIGEIDITKPFLDADEKAAFFINKKDGSLWKADLNKLVAN